MGNTLYRVVLVSMAVSMMACAPSADQLAQVRSEQEWAAYFRQVRQECSQQVPGACRRFEGALNAQEAYNLYYSKTVPGLATPPFVPATVTIHPLSIGGFR
jgi:hypothetical protein